MVYKRRKKKILQVPWSQYKILERGGGGSKLCIGDVDLMGEGVRDFCGTEKDK